MSKRLSLMLIIALVPFLLVIAVAGWIIGGMVAKNQSYMYFMNGMFSYGFVILGVFPCLKVANLLTAWEERMTKKGRDINEE